MSNLNNNDNSTQMSCHEKIDPPALSHTDLMQTMGRFNVTPY